MIAIGNDHRAVALKNEILAYLEANGYACDNKGTDSAEAADYTVFADKVTDAVLAGECEKGILICGTGIGMSIRANRRKGIRAAICHDVFTARMARQHNDANVMILGADIVGSEPALEALKVFLETDFSGEERHVRRIAYLDR